MAAVDYFLKLDGIDGESTAKGHEKWIELESFSWGISNHVTIGAGGAGAGKAVPSDFSLTMPYSKASPQIFLKVVSGQSIPTATVSAAKAGGEQTSDFLKWKMSDVFISSYATEGSTATPFEQVSLTFLKIEVSYSTQLADGSLDVPITGSFDFIKGAVG